MVIFRTGYSLSLREAKGGPQGRDHNTRTTSETKDECCMLAFALRFAHLASYITQNYFTRYNTTDHE